jgi:hypothetical protein
VCAACRTAAQPIVLPELQLTRWGVWAGGESGPAAGPDAGAALSVLRPLNGGGGGGEGALRFAPGPMPGDLPCCSMRAPAGSQHAHRGQGAAPVLLMRRTGCLISMQMRWADAAAHNCRMCRATRQMGRQCESAIKTASGRCWQGSHRHCWRQVGQRRGGQGRARRCCEPSCKHVSLIVQQKLLAL